MLRDRSKHLVTLEHPSHHSHLLPALSQHKPANGISSLDLDARFATTRWSVVLAAGHRTTGGRDSFASLCQCYSLYAYVRRRGHPPEDAQDLTQAFFTRLMEKNWVAAADRERAQKRGGRCRREADS